MTYEETVKRMGNAAAVVKLITGVANNAAWRCAQEAYDRVRRSPNYRQDVRRKFRECFRALHLYERQLIYATDNRMFHLADMSERVRKKYGNITDREFYDFWANTGGEAYTRTMPLITSLQNKYKLSLEREGVRDAYNVAWVMTAMAALQLAVNMYERAIDECVNGYQLPRKMLETVFSQFSLAHIARMWRDALCAFSPDSEHVSPSSLDERNIEMGLTQLCEAWADPTMLYNATMDTVAEFQEIFRTKGEQKKSLREMAEARDETIRELQQSQD